MQSTEEQLPKSAEPGFINNTVKILKPGALNSGFLSPSLYGNRCLGYYCLMETTLYILRHGETEWNRKGLLQGQLESPLTKEGIAQTAAFRAEITALNPHVVYSSHQGRARETAEILTADLQKEIQFNKGLSEMNFGVFQGHDWSYIEREMSEIHDLYRESGPDYTVPEGESHNQFHKRISSTLDEICQNNQGRKVLIISHGGSINKMICHVKGMEPSANQFFSTKNLALNIITYKEGIYSLKTPTELIIYK